MRWVLVLVLPLMSLLFRTEDVSSVTLMGRTGARRRLGFMTAGLAWT